MSDNKKIETYQLFARVDKELKDAFDAFAVQINMTSSGLIRELAIGLLQGRVTIAPPKLYTISTTDKE